MSAIYTGPTAEDLVCIPPELKARPQWVLWRGVDRQGKNGEVTGLDKRPYTTDPLKLASTTDPQTWADFQRCVDALPVVLKEWESENPRAHRGGGLGFVFTPDDPYCGIDLDHCAEADTFADWADTIIDALNSYTEITPSTTGVHILVRGILPPGGRKKDSVEMYDAGRFFTMTGWHLQGTPHTIEARQDALTTVHADVYGTPVKPQGRRKSPPSHQGGNPPRLDDAQLIAKAGRAANGGKFSALWAGDTSAHEGDDSAADLALCNILAFWTEDAAQIDRLFRLSGLMRDKWDAKRGTQTYGERTIEEALASQREHYTARKPSTPNGTRPPDPTNVPDVSLGYNDYVNARYLVRDHGHDLRYCYPWKRWLVWTGSHWAIDESGEVMRRAKATIRRLAQKVENLDDVAARALLAHVKSSLSTAKLKAMIENAQSEPGIAVQPEALDADPWVLNCVNGTLDLKVGALRPHTRADLLTKCLPINYDPQAPCPTWERFLWRIMGGTVTPDDLDMSTAQLEARHAADERARALIGFLQRTVGYALSGVIREHILPILWGTGRNGKTTLLNVLLKVFGVYGVKAPSELLMVSGNDRHPTEKTLLHGKRFVVAVETEQGRKLAEAFVKEATGGDPITAHRMREDFWTFEPTHTVFLATNHKPVITGTDTAIWERIRLVSFTVTIPPEERDTTLPAQLEKELPGILAWAVRGCLEWQRRGALGEPDVVQQDTQGYRDEMDDLGKFLTEVCLLQSDYKTQATRLLKAYQQWSGHTAETSKSFAAKLSERGYESKRFTTGNFWLGIGLPAEAIED